MSQVPVYIKSETVRDVLNWPMALETTKQAFIAASNSENTSEDLPAGTQPPRSFTWTSQKAGVLLSMPGYVGNYSAGGRKLDSLGCKLVTCFQKNSQREIPMPNILGNILLMDTETGQLKCIMEASDITAWRTAAASIVATKYLYFARPSVIETGDTVLAILGCGVEGRHHALGMCSTFNIGAVRLWNRTKSRAEALKLELEASTSLFKNTNVTVSVSDTSEECASSADVIVTSTLAHTPIVSHKALKSNVHINAVGAGVTHYSELDSDIYLNGKVYIDHKSGADVELKGLKADIVGEVGEVIIEKKPYPESGITIFQSLGMATEDIILAETIYQSLKLKDIPQMQAI